MDVDTEVAKKAIYWRGLFISQYAAFEFAIAELVSRGFLHITYCHLGQPPFGSAKKLKRLQQMIGLPGPLADYRSDLETSLNEFTKYEECRNFMVHAIMVPVSSKKIAFKMYDHREGDYSVGELQLDLSHLETIATLLSPISCGFTSLVAKMCRQIPLPEI